MTVYNKNFHSFYYKRTSIIYNLTNLYRENISLRDFEKEKNKKLSEIEKIKKEKDKLLSHNINEIISDKEFKERNDDCNLRLSKIEKELNVIKEEELKANNMEEEIKKLELLIENKVNNPSDEVLFELLDKIVVYHMDNKNKVKLKIYLKVGTEIEADYIKSKSQHFNSGYAYDKS